MIDRYGICNSGAMYKDDYGKWVMYEDAAARIAELEAVAKWYGEQVYLFANDTTEKADEAAVALDQDGGKRSRAALKPTQ
jgi:hypothetical protein